MPTKVCINCSVEKDIDLFPKTGRLCKECKARKLREYRASDPNYKEKRKAYREKNKGKIKKQKKDSYNRHADKVKKHNNDYYHKNAEKCRERQRKYQEKVETANMESWLTKCMKHARSADKKYDRAFDLDIEFLLGLFKSQNGRCAISNVPLKHKRKNLFSASIDRIDANGGHTKNNVQLVCQAMNLAKREFTNEHIFEFLMSACDEVNNVDVPDFDDFSYPESTSKYTLPKKKMVKDKLRDLCGGNFVPPSYDNDILEEDKKRIDEHTLCDYFDGELWRSHKPEAKSFAGKRLIWHYHPHLWEVRTQSKPLVSEVWGNGNIFEKALDNLVNGNTRISLDRIIRELIFAGAGIPSQIHPGFAKAVMLHFGCKPGTLLYDPFAGWGGRLLAAESLGVKYNACELSKPTYNGLVKMSNGDSTIKNIDCFDDEVPNVDIMFTSPPFGTEQYIGSQSFVDLNKVIEMTNHIPVRILHLSSYLAETIEFKDVIYINTKTRASAETSKECLVVL